MKAAQFFSTRLVLAALSFTVAEADQEIRVISWNLESGGAQVGNIAERILAFSEVDLWGLSEVDPSWKEAIEQATEDDEPGDFEPIMSSSGGSDRLLILYDKEQVEKLDRFEITWEDRYWFRSTMNPRPALVAHLRLKATGLEFLFMVNHLYRGEGVDPRRLDQAKRLNEWAAEQTLPVIAVGDYNFDWDLDAGKQVHNRQKGFGDLTACDRFVWLKPAELARTQDSSFNSVLDFIFLANATGVIEGESLIVVEPGDFPDTDETPDHRPVLGILQFKDD